MVEHLSLVQKRLSEWPDDRVRDVLKLGADNAK